MEAVLFFVPLVLAIFVAVVVAESKMRKAAPAEESGVPRTKRAPRYKKEDYPASMALPGERNYSPSYREEVMGEYP
jgi:hypothetical protein